MSDLAYAWPTMPTDDDPALAAFRASDPFAEFRAELQRHQDRLSLGHPQAAQRAGISSEAWRRLTRGWESNATLRAGQHSRPRRQNVIAMARAVEWDPDEALALMRAGEKKRGSKADPARYAPMSPGEREQVAPDTAADVPALTMASAAPDSLLAGLLRAALMLPPRQMEALTYVAQAMAQGQTPSRRGSGMERWPGGSSPARRDVVDGTENHPVD